MAKGIGIIYVVLYHCMAIKPFHSVMVNLIGSLMLIFFFISGYTFKPGKRSVLQNIKQRAKQILIPFYLYSAVVMAISAIYDVATGIATTREVIDNIICFYCGTLPNDWAFVLGAYWFLPVMFMSSVLFFLIVNFSHKSLMRTALISLALMAVSVPFINYTARVPWRLPLVPACTGVMLIGTYIGPKKLFENPPFTGWKLAASVLCAAVISAVLTVIFGDSLLLNAGNVGRFGGWSTFTAVILCLVQVYLLVFGCELMSGIKPLEKFFSFFGQNSMQILMTHMFIAAIIRGITGWSYYALEMYPSRNVRFDSGVKVAQSVAVTLLTIALAACWLLAWGKIKELFNAKIER